VRGLFHLRGLVHAVLSVIFIGDVVGVLDVVDIALHGSHLLLLGLDMHIDIHAVVHMVVHPMIHALVHDSVHGVCEAECSSQRLYEDTVDCLGE